MNAVPFLGGQVTRATLGGLCEQYRRGHAHVEAFDEPAHGHAHPPIHTALEFVADATVFVAEHDGDPRDLAERAR